MYCIGLQKPVAGGRLAVPCLQSHSVHSSCKRHQQEFKQYEVCIGDTEQLFIGDMLLFLPRDAL